MRFIHAKSFRKGLTFIVAIIATFSFVSIAMAEDKPEKTKASKEVIYGCQLMTPEEIKEHRETMRSLKTPEERLAFRDAHHLLMQERAKEKGVTLPEMGAGAGMGKGMGACMGMGAGMGMGKGMGMGPGMGMGKGMGAGTPKKDTKEPVESKKNSN